MENMEAEGYRSHIVPVIERVRGGHEEQRLAPDDLSRAEWLGRIVEAAALAGHHVTSNDGSKRGVPALAVVTIEAVSALAHTHPPDERARVRRDYMRRLDDFVADRSAAVEDQSPADLMATLLALLGVPAAAVNASGQAEADFPDPREMATVQLGDSDPADSFDQGVMAVVMHCGMCGEYLLTR